MRGASSHILSGQGASQYTDAPGSCEQLKYEVDLLQRHILQSIQSQLQLHRQLNVKKDELLVAQQELKVARCIASQRFDALMKLQTTVKQG